MILRSRDRAVIVTLVMAGVLGSVSPAMAAGSPQGNSESAAVHFRHGVVLYKESDFEGALTEFHRAQELSPNYRVLFDIGQALYSLQRYAEAIKAFEDYLGQGGAQIPAARKAAVEGDLRALRDRVGHLEILVNLEGAEVRVDDRAVGTSPLAAAVLVSVGHRKVTVVKADRAPLEKFIDIASGDRAKMSFEFPPAPVAAVPVPPRESTPAPVEPVAVSPSPVPSAPSEPSPSKTSLVWVPWAITGLAGAGAIVTGALTLSAKSTLTQDFNTFPGNPAAINSDRSRAKTLSIASDALLGATLVSFGVAMYVTIHTQHDRVGVQTGGLKLGLGLGGVRLAGDF